MTDTNEPSIFDLGDKVETDKDLTEFIQAMIEEMDRDPEWGERTLKEFLHGMWTFNESQVDEDRELTWNLVAEIMVMGFAYS